jgi:hypothetical protein
MDLERRADARLFFFAVQKCATAARRYGSMRYMVMPLRSLG